MLLRSLGPRSAVFRVFQLRAEPPSRLTPALRLPALPQTCSTHRSREHTSAPRVVPVATGNLSNSSGGARSCRLGVDPGRRGVPCRWCRGRQGSGGHREMLQLAQTSQAGHLGRAQGHLQLPASPPPSSPRLWPWPCPGPLQNVSQLGLQEVAGVALWVGPAALRSSHTVGWIDHSSEPGRHPHVADTETRGPGGAVACPWLPSLLRPKPLGHILC